MLLIIGKIISTLSTILLLNAIAKRLSPRYAGILGGFPLGSGLALYFFAWQHGEDFAASSALSSVSGLACSLVFMLVYWRLLIKRPQIRYIPLHTLIAFAAFIASGVVLLYLPQTIFINLCLILAAILLCTQLFKRISDQKITTPCQNKLSIKLQSHIANLSFRAGIATLSILLITAIADAIGSNYAGLLAVFPISFFPLIVILHINYGSDIVATTIKYYPQGLGALVCYTTAVYSLYPLLGMHWGTLLSLLASCIYLFIYAHFSR